MRYISLVCLVLILAACSSAVSPTVPSLVITPMAISSLAPASTSTSGGQTYFVSATGSDSNNGLRAQTAFLTIQHASDLTNPGDTVLVMDGTYTSDSAEAVVNITRSGASGAYITYKAAPGQHPKLHTGIAWQHILVDGASYIKIEGFEIQGNNANITLAQANEKYDYVFNAQKAGEAVDWVRVAQTNTGGITIRPDKATKTEPHHIEVRHNIIHDCPAGGIGTESGDYITVEDNTIFNNAWYTIFAESGISLWKLTDIDDNAGVKNVVRRNIVFGNETRVKWIDTKDYSDGNGIIIDQTLENDAGVVNKGRTLVTNNIVAGNGGSGIHCYKSSHVDIVNNTAYMNSKSPHLDYGSIFAGSCQDVNILNNILYVRPGKPANENDQNTNVRYDYNIYYNGLPPRVVGPHDLLVDPGFVNANEDIFQADFNVRPNSQAVDHGTADAAPLEDITGLARPQGSGFDIGAYETPGNTTPQPTPSPMPTATLAPPIIGAVIPAVGTPPVIDGNVDSQWPSVSYPIDHLIRDYQPRPASLGGSWRAMWDTNNLYVLIEVNDAHLVNDSRDTWDDDSPEIYIDGDNSKSTEYDSDDFTYRWRWNDPKVVEYYGSSIEGIVFAQAQTSMGYNFEIAIPWKTLKVTPADGYLLGFDIQVNNDDDGGDRDNKLAWFAKNDDTYQDPALFGVVQLTGK